jgi:hypothetical protein
MVFRFFEDMFLLASMKSLYNSENPLINPLLRPYTTAILTLRCIQKASCDPENCPKNRQLRVLREKQS